MKPGATPRIYQTKVSTIPSYWSTLFNACQLVSQPYHNRCSHLTASRYGLVRALQIEYSLISRGPEAAIFPLLAEPGIGVTAYGVLSRGLLSGSKPAAGDFRAHLPRFAGENGARNQRLVAALRNLAAEKHVSASQLAIAWVLTMTEGQAIVPVSGARTRAQLTDSLGALAVDLSPSDMTRIQEAVPAAGMRSDAHQMRMLASERPSLASRRLFDK